MTGRLLICQLDGQLEMVDVGQVMPEEAALAIRDHYELDLIRALARMPEPEKEQDELE